MSEPLPCPCCGSADLYTGHTEAMRVGIICNGCGLTLSRSYPDTAPNEIRRKPGNMLENLDAFLLEKAVTAWNRRPPMRKPS